MSAARGVVLSVVVGVAVSLLPGVPALAQVRVEAADPAGESSVPVSAVSGVPPAVQVAVSDPASVTWPVAGSEVVELSAWSGSGYLTPEGVVVAGSGSPGGLPVTVRPAAGEGAAAGSAGDGVPSSVRVTVWDREATAAAGVRGVVVVLSRADGVAAAARVAVEVSYAGFAHGYGGGFGSRLRLVTLPGCVLATPQLPQCQVLSAVPSTNDEFGGVVSAPAVEIPGGVGSSGAGVSPSASDDGGSGSEVVVALTADSSSGQGDFAATSLAPSYSWSAGGQGGDFATSYPVRVPPAPGGLVPELTLGYSSGGVDGRVASTNNQPSWLGEGWDLQVGYVEAHYRSCRDDGELIDDLCLDGDVEYSLVFGGRSTQLILDDAQGWFHTEADDGLRVEMRDGSWGLNQVHRGLHWVAYGQDGTAYWFGIDEESTQSVPVFGNDAGEACHGSTLAASYCDMGYRWNLRRVADRRGNVIDYLWDDETQNYGRYGNAAAHAYDRGAVLRWVEYGANQVAGTTHTGQVELQPGWRCLQEPCMGGTSNTWKWYDTPWDLYCAETLTSCPNVTRPVFYSWFRLSAIHTRVRDGAGGWAAVDRWTMGYSFPGTGDGTSPALFLEGIDHTGHVPATAGGADPNLAGVSTWFDGIKTANRVHNESMVAMYKYRLSRIATSVGGLTDVGYAPTECTTTTLPAENANTKRCFPVYWSNGASVWNWFHKYVVASVTENGAATGDGIETWSYQYANSSNSTNSQVMWAWDDAPNIPDDRKSWTQWRGYLHVTSNHGPATGPARTEVRKVFYRGLNGDRADRAGGIRTVTFSDGDVGNVVDDKPLRGFMRTETTMDAATGQRATWVRHLPAMTLSAYRLLGYRKAYIVREVSTITAARRRDGTTRTRQVDTSYDMTFGDAILSGLPLAVADHGDLAVTGDETCTATSYAENAAAWMLAFPTTVLTAKDPAACGSPTASGDDPGLWLSGVRYHYDDEASLTRGLVTRTEAASGVQGYPPKLPSIYYLVWAPQSRASYDVHGRVTGVWDALDRYTATVYTPTVGGPTTRMVATNPAGHVTDTLVQPAWGTPRTVTDPNGKTTTVAYDGLGRLTKVWLPGRSTAATPNLEYGYLLRASGGSVVTTKRLGPNGNQIISHDILDGRLRPRQRQATAPDGNRVTTDTSYDPRGLVAKTATFYGDTPPDTTLVTPIWDINLPSQHHYLYDSLGRQSADILTSYSSEMWRTTTSHWADQVYLDQPAGGTDTTTFLDAQGRTSMLRQHSTVPLGLLDTGYGYDRLGRLVRVSDPAGNQWSYSYDLRGRQTRASDPDKGTTTFSYDDAGQLLTATDARPVTLAYRYDGLGRKTGLFRDSVATGTKLAEWVYDTVAVGQPTSATRFAGGQAYTSRVESYDERYRPLRTQLVIPTGPLATTYTVDTSYKPDGSIATQTLPAAGGLSAETLTHSYSAAGLPVGLTGSTSYIASTSYHFDGQIFQRHLGVAGRQVRQTYTVEAATRRLQKAAVEVEGPAGYFTGRVGSQSAYSYDPAGNVTAIAGATNGAEDQVECFRYDSLRRLVDAWSQASTGCGSPQRAGADPYRLAWQYDVVGNRTKQTDYGATAATVSDHSYPAPGSAQPHTLRQVVRSGATTGTDSYSYDPAGNTTARPGQTLTWDDEGHLGTVTASGQTTSYLYDADGTRLLATDPTKQTLYLPDGTELTHTTATGQTTGTRYYAGVAVRTNNGGLTWLHADHHGTTTIAVNAADLSVQRRRSLPFGGPRGPQPAGWPGQKGFVGGTTDPTGLTHLGAREYDPTTGRFISVDPIVDHTDPQQVHGYSYANNNPTTLADPAGLLSTAECGPDGVNCPGSLGGYDPCATGCNSSTDFQKAQEEFIQGGAPEQGQRVVIQGPASPGNGIVVVRFFINDALQGPPGAKQHGDDRGFTTDPAASYRVAIVWDTETGEIIVLIRPTCDDVGCNTALEICSGCHNDISQETVWNSPPSTPTTGELAVSFHLTPAGELRTPFGDFSAASVSPSIDGQVRVHVGESRSFVEIVGDDMPDVEVIQYRPDEASSTIAFDEHGRPGWVELYPVAPDRHVVFVNGRQCDASNTGIRCG